jgi:precorrin-2 dehydrogenase/sirohydrochlorin ferrochelatase
MRSQPDASGELDGGTSRLPPYVACLDLAGRLCVVVGGGSVAVRKVAALLVSGARVRVVSPQVGPHLEALAREGRVEWVVRGYETGDLRGATLAFAATNDAAANRRIEAEAAAQSVLVNVADASAPGNFAVPAVLRREGLTIAIATGGDAPGFAQRLRDQLEQLIGPEYGQALALYASARPAVLAAPAEQQSALWDDLFALDLPALIRAHNADVARETLAAWLQQRGLSTPR